MPSNGYPEYASHPWHHYMAAGAASTLELVLPFLVVALLIGAGRRGADWARTHLSRRSSRATSVGVATRTARAVSPVLASERERDETASLVSRAVGEGRLSIEEGMQRIDAVLRSRHRHQLGALVADLPTHPSTAPRPFTSTPLRAGLLAVTAAVVLAAVLVQALVGLWELWPFAVLTLGASTLLPLGRIRSPQGRRISLRDLPSSDVI